MEPDHAKIPTDGWTRLCEGVLRSKFGRMESSAVANAIETLASEKIRRQTQSRRWLLKTAAGLVFAGLISWAVSTRWQFFQSPDKSAPAAFSSTGQTGLGAISLEIWRDVPGNTITSLTNNATFREESTEIRSLPAMEFHSVPEANFGDRIRGWLNPPASGAYEFWIASDDASELWLSPEPEPDRRQLIARVDGWTAERAWDFSANQHSHPIQLETGRKYYFEVLHKQGLAGAHLSVAWSRAGAQREVVDQKFVTPYRSNLR